MADVLISGPSFVQQTFPIFINASAYSFFIPNSMELLYDTCASLFNFQLFPRYCWSLCYVSVFLLFQIKYIPPWSTLPSYYQWPYYMPRVDNPWVEGVILEGYWIRYELCHSQNQNIATENLTSKC